MNKAKGSSVERQIVSKFRERGFAVVRAPASGSRRRDPIPDIIAMKNGIIVLIEMKSRKSNNRVYIKKEQALGIYEFAKKAGGELFIGVKIPSGTFFIKFNDLKITPNGNYVIDEEALSKAMSFEELIRYVESKFVKTLDNFI